MRYSTHSGNMASSLSSMSVFVPLSEASGQMAVYRLKMVSVNDFAIRSVLVSSSVIDTITVMAVCSSSMVFYHTLHLHEICGFALLQPFLGQARYVMMFPMPSMCTCGWLWRYYIINFLIRNVNELIENLAQERQLLRDMNMM